MLVLIGVIPVHASALLPMYEYKGTCVQGNCTVVLLLRCGSLCVYVGIYRYVCMCVHVCVHICVTCVSACHVASVNVDAFMVHLFPT